MRKLPPMNAPEGNPFADPATWPASRQYEGIQNQSGEDDEIRRTEAFMRGESTYLKYFTTSWFDVFGF